MDKENEKNLTDKKIVKGNANTAIIIIVALIVLAGAFCLGRISENGRFNEKHNYSPQEMMGERGKDGGKMGPGMMGNYGYGRGTASGQITAINGNNITIKDADGTSYSVVASTTTSVYNQGKIAKLSDLKENNSVTVFGKPNSNGEIIATDIEIK